jgi:regulation of enolase protein 1 (concanavalin A-like superfamily)
MVVTVAPGMNDSNAVNFTVSAQPLPSGWLDQDVGATGVLGSASYANSVFTVKGGGTQIYGSADAFHFVYQPLTGDGTIVARVVSLQGASGYGSAGVMIRESLNAGSTNAGAADWGAYGRIYYDLRTATGGNTAQVGSVNVSLPYWVKVSRSGSTFSAYTSTDGVTWVQLGASQTISMAANVDVGLAVNSGTTTLATATFDNVSVTSP